MRFSDAIPLTAAVLNLLVTLFVLTRPVSVRVRLVYFLWGAALVVWNFGTFEMFLATDPAEGLFWARFLTGGVMFLPITLLHLSLLVAQIRAGRWLVAGYLVPVLLLAGDAAGLLVRGVRDTGYAYYAVAGPLYYVFAVFFLLCNVATIAVLATRRKAQVGPHRARLGSLLWASLVLILFGANDLLPILGFDRYPVLGAQVLPWGSLAAIFFGVVVGYSVLQHQLLDVRVTMTDLAARLVRLAFVFVLALVGLLLIDGLLPQPFTPQGFTAALLVFAGSMVLASMLFPRLFGEGSDLIERRLLGDRFAYHERLRAYVDEIGGHDDPSPLLQELDEVLVVAMGIRRHALVAETPRRHEYTILRAHPGQADAEPHLRDPGMPHLFAAFSSRTRTYFGQSPAYAEPGEAGDRAASAILGRMGYQLCFPLYAGAEAFSLLFLGEKTDGEPFTRSDIDLLVALTRNLALVLGQMRLQEQLLQAREMDLLGRMSRGIAHDLNNLLTPAWTYLQLAAEGADGPDARRSLLPVAARNVETMRGYIREALFFSEHRKPDFRPGSLDRPIDNAIELALPQLQRRGLRAEKSGDFGAAMLVDELLLQRAFSNILANAIDASPAGGRILIRCGDLPQKQGQPPWVRLEFIDEGPGISPELLGKIGLPYFTTKDTGDDCRGFGLGLPIARQIVQSHGGKLQAVADGGKGACIQVDLPLRPQGSDPTP